MGDAGSAGGSSRRGHGSADAGTTAARFGALIEHSIDLVSIYDEDGRFTFASPSHEWLLGYEPDELVGTNAMDLVHPDDRDEVNRAFTRQLEVTGVPSPVEHRFRHKDGSWSWLEAIAVDLRGDPDVGGILVNARDVTDRRRAELLGADQARILELIARGAPLEEALSAVAAMLERWAPGAHGAVAIVDEDAHELRFVVAPKMSAAALDAIHGMSVALGRPPGLDGDLVVAMVDSDPYHPSEGAILRAHGYRMFWAAIVTDVEGRRALGAVVLLRCDDVTPDDSDRRRLTLGANLAALAIERDRAQGRLAHQASHDSLTGLPNRETVLDRLRRMVDRPHHDGPGTAVLFLDIDRFKVFNDSVGHEAGDRLLVELGERLREALRPGDLVARFGGDEFVMVCERVGGELDAYMLATRIIDLVQDPFTIGGNEVVVTASIGIAMVDGGEPESLLRDADAAMYWAKERGRARAELFDDELRRRVVRRLDIEGELRHALERNELMLHFQPVVSLETYRLTGFEALLRWRHPTRGLLGPDDFLEVAEETGLARPIGAWVRDTACSQAVRWQAEHPEWGGFVMGVNLTAAELYERDLVAGIERTISSTGIDPVSLAFEISERYIAEDTTSARGLLLRIRELGVHLALDDFGTGAAALVHLKALPVTSIKIDRAFVRGLGIDRSDDAIVEAVVELTRRLDLITVAEGVETARQELRLRETGCRFAQGHRFAAALPPDEVEAYLKRRGGRIVVAASRVEV